MDDKQYTITKFVGEPKQYGDKTRIAFNVNEEPGKVISLFTKFPQNVKEGGPIFGHIEEQQKDGKTYFNFFFGKNPNKGGMSEVDKERMTVLENKITTLTLRHDKLVNHLMDKGIVPRPVEKIAGTNIDYPQAPDGIPFENDPLEGTDPFATIEA